MTLKTICTILTFSMKKLEAGLMTLDISSGNTTPVAGTCQLEDA